MSIVDKISNDELSEANSLINSAISEKIAEQRSVIFAEVMESFGFAPLSEMDKEKHKDDKKDVDEDDDDEKGDDEKGDDEKGDDEKGDEKDEDCNKEKHDK